ncbi:MULTISPECIES: bifunctional DNA primase/polymerase [unclassified Pseudonocardia]|uniref:bifunctional DNA primase/polymerase n=1 Tax=unclassified Pseudonocardia TaxID=2619320 RepID=UPI0001FFDB3D|nr:bifunctional DNA primase/polymerase [Pseudonocardia sp. Ae707_Ps1]
MRHVALDAARAGHHVFPTRPHAKIPALHGERSCRGRGVCAESHQGWEPRATTDPDQIRRWWSRTPFGVAIACGPSRLVVIDLDTGTEPLPDWGGATTGWEVLTRAATAHGHTITDTYTVATPSGGHHLYYRAPQGPELRNTQGGTGHSIGPLVDTRAGGGYIVGAGTTRPEGTYTVTCHRPIADLPEWLTIMLTPPPPLLRDQPEQPLDLGPRQARAYLRAIVDGETDLVRHTPTGQRQFTLLGAARTLGRLVAGHELGADAARDALIDAAAPHLGVDGFTLAEAERTIDRGIRYGMQMPRRLRPAEPEV